MNQKTKIAVIVALAAAASMIFSACNPECVDTFDCAPKLNNIVSCVDNKCGYKLDAGS